MDIDNENPSPSGHLSQIEYARKPGPVAPLLPVGATQLLGNLGVANEAKKLPKQLSGGQSQRVAIARALANDPLLILADEPTGNLDTAASGNVQKILMDLALEYGRAVVVVTHDRDFAAAADHVIVMSDGRILGQ